MKQALNQIVAFLLMYAVMLQFFGQLSTVLHYELNKQELTDLYCINKNAPELSCYARCYLKTQLAEHDTAHDANLPVEVQLKFPPLFIVTIQSFSTHFVVENTSIKHLFSYIQLSEQLRGSKYFHPPTA